MTDMANSYSPSPDDIDVQLWALIQQVKDIMLRTRERELMKYGISEIQAVVMYVIRMIGHDATPGEISQRVSHEPHTVSALLQRMEKDELVRRTRDLNKKSMVRVELTEKGQQIRKGADQLESVHRTLSALSTDERMKLRELLLKVRDSACQHSREFKPIYPI
jgi:DNA-binding MarR family transcriptional regulator